MVVRLTLRRQKLNRVDPASVVLLECPGSPNLECIMGNLNSTLTLIVAPQPSLLMAQAKMNPLVEPRHPEIMIQQLAIRNQLHNMTTLRIEWGEATMAVAMAEGMTVAVIDAIRDEAADLVLGNVRPEDPLEACLQEVIGTAKSEAAAVAVAAAKVADIAVTEEETKEDTSVEEKPTSNPFSPGDDTERTHVGDGADLAAADLP